MTTTSQILFLCSGNYYRSRFCEVLFNNQATARKLAWRATSRGLKVDAFTNNVGPMAVSSCERLQAMGIQCESFTRMPQSAIAADFLAAQHVVAVKRAEHESLMLAQFPTWHTKVEYWDVHDMDVWTPEQTLPELERRVEELVRRLAGNYGR